VHTHTHTYTHTHTQTHTHTHTHTQGEDHALRYLQLGSGGGSEQRFIQYFKGHSGRVTKLAVNPKNDTFLSAAQVCVFVLGVCARCVCSVCVLGVCAALRGWACSE
jgi:hypothetical protein